MKLVLKAIKRQIGNAVGAMIPLHFKRILFLMTLYRYMRGLPNFDLKELEELDQHLQLAGTSARALVIPGTLSSLVWGVRDQQSEESAEVSFNSVLRRSPCWLLYGRKEDIERDFGVLSNFVKTHSHA